MSLTQSRWCARCEAVHRGPCARRQAEARRFVDQRRGTAAERGYGARWRKASLKYLAASPLCVACGNEGRIRPATVTDHIRPHRGDPALFWDQANWQPLCAECHNRKTGEGQ